MPKSEIRDCIFQLIGQDALVQTDGEYPILRLNAASWAVMKGTQTVRLIQTRMGGSDAPPEKGTLPFGTDPALFELLRGLRREQAQRLNVPPYQIFADTVLTELARCRPTTLERMRMVSGIGDVKLREFGAAFLALIATHAAEHSLATDLPPPSHTVTRAPVSTKLTPAKQLSFSLFREGVSLDEVAKRTKLTRSTVAGHLADFIQLEKPKSIAAWVPKERFDRIAAAAKASGTAFLKPIFLALNEEVPYDEIRAVIAFVELTGP